MLWLRALIFSDYLFHYLVMDSGAFLRFVNFCHADSFRLFLFLAYGFPPKVTLVKILCIGF